MIVQQGFTFERVGTSHLIIDRGMKESPFRVVAVPDSGTATAQTGWCKTRSYCEKTIERLTVDGFTYAGEIDVKEADADTLAMLRISRWSPSDLKSMLQKYSRRGDPVQAVNVAHALMGTKEGQNWLTRRLPILACEDKGWDMLPLVSGHKTEEAILEAVWVVATVAGSHEAGHLNAVAGENAVDDDIVRLWRDMQADGGRAWWKWPVTGSVSKAVVEAVAMNVGMHGGGDRGMLYAAAAFAVTDNLDAYPQVVNMEQGRPAPEMPGAPPWWALDSHSSSGRVGVARAAARLKIGFDRLANIMFFAETFQLAFPRTVPDRYEAEAEAVYARWSEFDSWEALDRYWDHARPIVQEEMTWAIEQKL